MSEFMQRILKRAGLAVLGIVVTVAYWSFTGQGGGDTAVQGIPATVWEGDGESEGVIA